MDNVDKSRRPKKTALCEKCGETYSLTYKRCPFCGGAAARNSSDIDIQGPDLYDQPPVTVRPSVPNPPPPPPAAVAVADDFMLDLDIDFVPELEDETSSVPKPPPGSVGGKRLAGKGGKQPKPVQGTPGKPRGRSAARGLLLVLSLLVVAAAIYIVSTKAMPLIDAFLANREENSALTGEDDPSENGDGAFSLTETRVSMTAPGMTKQLIPVYEPAEEVGPLLWSSDDTDVVTVSEEGRLTSVGVGSATVTVSREDGTKALCMVSCTWDEDSLLENLSLNKSDFTLRSSDPAVQMRVLGFDGTPPEIVWESQNPEIATITEAGLVTWAGTGATKIIATINGNLILECAVHCR